MLFVARRSRAWVDAMSVDDLVLAPPTDPLPSGLGNHTWLRVVIEATDRVRPVREGDYAVADSAHSEVEFLRL